ncbi:hypothetical protein ACWGN5_26135 [Streptomyces sp. NPDC055815]
MRTLLVLGAALLSLGSAPAPARVPLPERMADTGGGSQLITAEASDTDSTTGTLTWWDRRGGRWVEGLPRDCRAEEAERLASYGTQYAYALVIGFNYERPVRGRGAGIFLHVNGRGATAGCVSVPEDAMRAVLAWADPARRPHIAVGTRGGPTAITGY